MCAQTAPLDRRARIDTGAERVEQQQADPHGDLPFVQFSTAGLSAADAFAVWRDSVSVIFDSTLEADDAKSFHAEMGVFHLGDLLFGRTSLGMQRFARTPRMIRRDGLDHFLVQIYSKGGYRGDADGEPIDLHAGEISVLDLAKPLSSKADAADTLSLMIPRNMLDPLLITDALHGSVLRGTPATLFSAYAYTLQRRLPSLRRDETPLVVNATVELLAALLRPQTTRSDDVMTTVRQELALARAKRYIENHLPRPQLTPEEIRTAAAVSRASLYRMFEPYGGVGRYILARRLARCCQALENPRDRRLIAEIAYAHGFVSEAHFSRAFCREYGVAPGEARRGERTPPIAAARTAQTSATEADFGDWVRRFQRNDAA